MGSRSTGATPGTPPGETGTSARPSPGTAASGPPGAGGAGAAPPAGPGPGPGGGGWRAARGGWGTAAGRPRSPSRLVTTSPVQVGEGWTLLTSGNETPVTTVTLNFSYIQE